MSLHKISRSLPPFIFGVQGVGLILSGVVALISPATAAGPDSLLQGTPLDVVRCLSTTSLALGVSYILATWRGDRLTMAISVLGRAGAGVLFWKVGGKWKEVVPVEIVFGCLTIGALALDWRYGLGEEVWSVQLQGLGNETKEKET